MMSTVVFLQISVYTLLMCTGQRAVLVIGGNKTVVQGDAVTLPCHLTDTTEPLSQMSWQRKTRKKPQTDNFFIVLPPNKAQFLNGQGDRFTFIGNFSEKNGSIRLSNASLMDEGIYTCIFTLFPSGNHETVVPLNLLVPPVINVKDNHPIFGDDEVSFATCTAAGSRPPAEVRWLTDSLAGKVRATVNSTQHANGTTTTVSSLFGVPTREINQALVHCVVSSPALSKDEMKAFTIQVYFPYTEVSIHAGSKDSFQCVTQGNSAAKFTWSRSNQSWPQADVRTKGASLQFLSTESHLNGIYQCEASNPYGRGRAYLYVHMQAGSCKICWILFGLLLLLTCGVAAGWYIYKSGVFSRGTSDNLPSARSTSKRSEVALTVVEHNVAEVEGVLLAEKAL